MIRRGDRPRSDRWYPARMVALGALIGLLLVAGGVAWIFDEMYWSHHEEVSRAADHRDARAVRHADRTPARPAAAGPEQPDGPPPVAAADLDPGQLAALIRLPASGPVRTDSCGPADLRLAMTGFDAAAGHRYSAIVATNISARTCSLVGYPGLGVRGDRGTELPVQVEQRPWNPSSPGTPVAGGRSAAVTLQPGSTAAAELEWTGNLAGSRQERAELIVVQLTVGNPVIGMSAEINGDLVDIGAGTTLKVSFWHASA